MIPSRRRSLPIPRTAPRAAGTALAALATTAALTAGTTAPSSSAPAEPSGPTTTATAATAVTAAAAATGTATPAPRPGRTYPPRGKPGRDYPLTELVGQVELPKLDARQVQLSTTKFGFRFIGGRAGNRLTITATDEGRLRFVDRAARRWTGLPSSCRRAPSPRGVAATCRVPDRFGQGELYLEIWPRLGGDHVDARGLPGRFRLWALTDAGRDQVWLGRGDSFANTAFDRDVVVGGPGHDWIRVGEGPNRAVGGAGDDRVVGADGRDVLAGGPGDDLVGGLEGNDRLSGGEGADRVAGGPGRDVCLRDARDKVLECERVLR